MTTTIQGTVTGAVESREIAKGRWVARFALRGEDKGLHTCVAWGTVAEKVKATMKAGDLVTVQGREVNRNYTTKKGTVQKVTEIIINVFLIHT